MRLPVRHLSLLALFRACVSASACPWTGWRCCGARVTCSAPPATRTARRSAPDTGSITIWCDIFRLTVSWRVRRPSPRRSRCAGHSPLLADAGQDRKVALMGSRSVGKTSLITQFIESKYVDRSVAGRVAGLTAQVLPDDRGLLQKEPRRERPDVFARGARHGRAGRTQQHRGTPGRRPARMGAGLLDCLASIVRDAAGRSRQDPRLARRRLGAHGARGQQARPRGVCTVRSGLCTVSLTCAGQCPPKRVLRWPSRGGAVSSRPRCVVRCRGPLT